MIAGSRPRTVGVIPARLASSRFPEKVLASATGKPLIVHVLEQARKARSLDDIVVAADHARIVAAVEAAGGKAVLTREDHPIGTSRLAEVATKVAATTAEATNPTRRVTFIAPRPQERGPIPSPNSVPSPHRQTRPEPRQMPTPPRPAPTRCGK